MSCTNFPNMVVSTPSDCLRFARMKGNIQRVKYRLSRKKKVPARKLLMKFSISDTNVQRIMKNDLGLRSYKMVTEALPSDDQKIKRENICALKEDMRILFLDEKCFDIDGVYNSQNNWVRAVSRADTDKKDGIQ